MSTTARDLMTPSPVVVTPDDDMIDAATLLRDHRIGALPVVHDLASMKLVGIITDRDIAVRCIGAHHGTPGQVRTHMTWAPLVTASVETPADEIARRMQRAAVRRVPVIDETGSLIGIVALADLLRGWARDHPREMLELLASVSAPPPATVNA